MISSSVEGTTVHFSGTGTITAQNVIESGSYLTYKTIFIDNDISEVGESCFSRCELLEIITFSNSILILGTSSFTGLRHLSSVTLGSNLQIIEANCFYNCNNLTSILIPKSCQTLQSQAFIYCSKLTTVEFEAGSKLTTILELCFYGTGLTKISLPDSLETIPGDRTFGSTNLKTLHFGPNVRSIGFGICALCLHLDSFTVSSSNLFYQSINGILFTKDTIPILVMYPPGRTENYVIPSTVYTLSSYSFSSFSGQELSFEEPVQENLNGTELHLIFFQKIKTINRANDVIKSYFLKFLWPLKRIQSF